MILAIKIVLLLRIELFKSRGDVGGEFLKEDFAGEETLYLHVPQGMKVGTFRTCA
jgi:hypothetical protein